MAVKGLKIKKKTIHCYDNKYFDENLCNSAAGFAGFCVQTLGGPLFNINDFHLGTLELQIQTHAHLFEIFEASIDENLHQNSLTSLYLAKIFLIIFRKSLGLLVI